MDLTTLRTRIEGSNQTLPLAAVIDFLVANYNGAGTVYSPAHLAEVLTTIDQSKIIDALNALCGLPFNVLERQWFYHDDATGEDYQISDDVIEEALVSKEFVHPQSGEPVADFQDKIGLSYSSTSLSVMAS